MTDVTGSINIEQEEPQEPVLSSKAPEGAPDNVVPLIGGDMGIDEVKANFNALLYLVTEQMAIQLKILDALVSSGHLTIDEVNDKILVVTGDQAELSEIYNQMFARFVGYYSSLRQLMSDGKVFQAEAVDTSGETNEGI